MRGTFGFVINAGVVLTCLFARANRSRLLRGGIGGRLSRFVLNEDVSVHITFASSVDEISLSNELIACDISGLREARVRQRSSVPYRCLTGFGRAGLLRRSQVRTTKFSRVGESSSSSVICSLWRVMLHLDPRRLSWTNAMSLWNKSSGSSFGCNLILSKSTKWAPVAWKPKCSRIAFHMISIDALFFTMVLREIIGQ